jgi:hypothetical protein
MTLSDVQSRITFLTDANTNNFPNPDRLIAINTARDDIHLQILESQDEWDFDDKNNTDFAILTTDLLADQSDYALPSNIIKIKRVEITYDGTNWHKAQPIDVNEDSDPTNTSSIADNYSVSEPFYDIQNNSIILYPIPSSAVTNGLKIWDDRSLTEFSLSDLTTGTSELGFDRQIDDLVPLKASYDYLLAKTNDKGKIDRIDKKIKELEDKLRKLYGSKQRDRNYSMASAFVDYS